MWWVKSWANAGSTSSRSRSAAGSGSLAGWSTKAMSRLVLAVITVPLSPGRRGCPAPHGHVPLACNSPISRLAGPKGVMERSLACYALRDVVTDLESGSGRPRSLAIQQVLGDRLLDPRRLGGEPDMLAEHRRRQDRGGRGRLLLARDVGRAALHGLEHARRCQLRGDAGARPEPRAAGHPCAQCGQDVAAEVVGDDHL